LRENKRGLTVIFVLLAGFDSVVCIQQQLHDGDENGWQNEQMKSVLLLVIIAILN